jgi:hypothetical protein
MSKVGSRASTHRQYSTMDLSYDAVASSRYLMHAHIILYQDFGSTDDQNAPPRWLDTRRYDPPPCPIASAKS